MAAADHGGEAHEEKAKNLNGSKVHHRAADRAHQWNRAIPEAGYITLGTIRYGVRYSGRFQSSSVSPGSTPVAPTADERRSSGTNSESRSGSSDRSISSSSNPNPSCCCIGSSGINLPWSSNYARTKLPVPSSAAAKNRTLSTSQSSSFSLGAMSAPDPPPAAWSARELLQEQQRDESASVTASQLQQKIEMATITPPMSTVTVPPQTESSSELAKIESSATTTAPSPVSVLTTTTSTSTNPVLSSSVIYQSCDSVRCGTASCCKLNPTSVLVERCRELSVSSTSKTNSSVCCYTIASNSKAISKQSTRIGPKRIPRTVLQQSISPVRPGIPPPVPPKPTSGGCEDQSIDPANFRRKIQKFEQQSAIDCIEQHNNRFEFFGCFSGEPHGSPDRSECDSSVSETSLTNHVNASDNHAILKPKNFGTPVDNPISRSDKQNGIQPRCTLRYNSVGKPLPFSSSESLKLKCFSESQPATVVIRKLTPKLSRKPFGFGDSHVRGDSEDRLIGPSSDADCPAVSSSGGGADDDSDIGFIDSSGDGDHLSSLSDLDIHNLTYKTVTPITKNSCNLSFDSVPKIINNNNSHEHYSTRSLSARDLYDSLSDIESSTISCLSEDSFCCLCSGSDQNIKSGEDLCLSTRAVCLCGERLKSFASESPKTTKDRNKCGNKENSQPWCESSDTAYSPSPPPLPNLPPPSGGQLPLGSVRGPVLKRVPAIESFGYINKGQLHARGQQDKALIMEKRRNTLDRLQRLGFGRRSSPSPTQETKSSSRKSSEKSERLKELTELLKGNRSSPTPPPVPPPRKLRQSNSFDKASDSEQAPTPATGSDNIIPMDEEEEHIPVPVNRKSDEISHRNEGPATAPIINTQKPSLYHTLRPNTSVSNLESLIYRRCDREKSKSPPVPAKEDEIFTKLPRAESKSIVGSYAQKTIPFRSASFSQIDYSSGKYIKSALGAIRDRLRRDKEPSVVENANLTLPRKKDEKRSNSPRRHRRCGSADREFQIIPLKKTELSISLNFEPENERVSLEELVNPPDVILEEEASTMENEKLTESQEKLSDASANESPPTESSEAIVPTVIDQKSRETSPGPASMPLREPCQANVVTLTEEEIPMESPPENFLQTATTCLIPVPVYECAAQDWSPDSSSDRWIDVAQDEIGITPEIVQVIQEDTTRTSKADGEVSSFEGTGDLILMGMDQVPTISVSHDSPQPNETTPDNEEYNEDKRAVESVPADKNNDFLREQSTEQKESNETKSEAEQRLEYTEVRKRYSNDDLKAGDRSQSVDSNLSRGGEEKRRLDKSRRRKGMYIQWPSIDKPDVGEWSSNIDTPGVDDDLKNKEVALDLMKVVDQCDDSGPLFLTCRTPDDNRTPGSQCAFDPCTPDSECNRPIWPKINRRTSLTCQSSEEKDDTPSIGSPYPKSSQRSLQFLRSDSISDNESDRTPPSREQTSPSPAPGDQDLKRYSKRPLRGPYGQMLEAEMKKPTKVNYDEILEVLRDSDRASSLSVHAHGAGNRSFDETHSAQHLKSSRVRKSNTSLPIPSHTRAASTPSQLENTTTTASIGGINPQDKRYQSNIDTSSLDSQVNSRLKEPKKFSLDSARDHSPKRASSDTNSPDIKQHPKRSASNVSEKHQKRSLDEIRLSQTSRTPSERSMLSESGKGANILPTPELLAELLKGSSERLISEQRQQMFSDTRTHIVQEIFRNEQSYVDSLHTVVVKYLNVLKTPDYAGMIDSKTVDDIFFMVPEILSIHEKFLSEMKSRLDSWEPQQKVGDAFIETFSKTEVLETYTSFVNNCNRAKDAIRMTCQSRPSFARFLEAMSREHKGKLTLDNLLIKPVQKFPNYEMLFTRLIKHTDMDHPDQKHLQEVLKLVHDILVHINCKEKEVMENGQREATLRELEGVIEGATELVVPDRQFLIFDLVSMPSGQGARKERGFFLFSDLLVITSIKRRSGTIRKPNTTTCPGSVASTLDTNKYKFLTKVSLDSLEIVKTKDENLRRIMNEIEQLADDCNKLQQIAEVTATLKYPHQILEDTIRDLHREVQRQLSERQSNDAQLNLLELTVNSPSGTQKLSIVFSKPEKRSQWEEAFNEAKQKLAASLERHPIPEFLTSIPIRKTRAGLQFTCAAPTLSSQKDVWVCNSDGYVGQVCVLSLTPEPTVTSCNGVCNARILCVASVPAYSESKSQRTSSSNEETPRSSRNSNSSSHCHIAPSISSEKKKSSPKADRESDIQLDSNSSSEESEIEGGTNTERIPSPAPSLTAHHQQQDSNSDETDSHQSTMWLGTEDGCIHVYNCTDNIRIKKNKIKIQHVSAVYSILYLDNRVFVALANGDICVYLRDNAGWNTTSPLCISIGTVSSPVNRLLNVHGKLWCSIQGIIKVLDTQTLQVENQIQISSDSKPITNMAVSSNYVWISIQNSAHIKCFHSNSHDLILEVNLAPSVNKMLSNCDDIIRQHKAACLRVTSLLACRDLIWIGTSAGVLLTIPAQGYTKGQISNMPVVTGIPHGHTGHVRFLTCVDTGLCSSSISIDDGTSDSKGNRNSIHSKTKSETGDVLIISGGDGYEDFRSSGANTMSEIAGREDSTNHLLLWQM